MSVAEMMSGLLEELAKDAETTEDIVRSRLIPYQSPMVKEDCCEAGCAPQESWPTYWDKQRDAVARVKGCLSRIRITLEDTEL